MSAAAPESAFAVATRDVEDHVLLAGQLDAELKGTVGEDTDGNEFKSILHLWDRHLRLSELDIASEAVAQADAAKATTKGAVGIREWYGKSESYWKVRLQAHGR